MNKEKCAATTANGPNAGNPCQRAPVHGAKTCQAHGGAKYKPNDVIAKALDGIVKPRCKYTRRNGEQCKNSPIRGGTVCKKHGGAAAHIQRKAKERLMYMIEPALVELGKILSAPSTGDGDKLRAISMVLDRTGYGKGMTVEHTQTKPWEVTMEHILTQIPAEGLPEVEDIEDALVVEDIREETLPAPEPLRPRFDGPRIGPINGGEGGILSYGTPRMTSSVDHPSRRGRDD